MGMDVYGVAPTSEKGEYFRRNVWGWHPLWNYVEDEHPEIACLVDNPHTNDGDGLDEADAMKLGALLLVDIETGVTAKYIRARNHRLANLERPECWVCKGTGIRTDDAGDLYNMPTKELSPEMASLTGRTYGWCNGCDGEGKMDATETNYHVNQQDVKEFAEFLMECGGFEIC